MFFQEKSRLIQIYNKAKKSNKNSSLPLTNNDICMPLTATGVSRKQYSFERTALFTSLKGSLTVEAALLLPFFFLICVAMTFFIQVFSLHEEIQGGVYLAARECAQDRIIVESGIDPDNRMYESIASLRCIALARKNVKEHLGTSLDKVDCLLEGYNGLQFFHSSVKDGIVDVIVYYRIKTPEFLGFKYTMPVVQRCRMGIWSGAGEKISFADSDYEMVYITETGTVYHEKSSCTHIKLSIEVIQFSDLEIRRNSAGGIYHPCEKCAKKGDERSNVYITDEGSHYHNTLECSGLKRTISMVKKADVKDRKACSKCCK